MFKGSTNWTWGTKNEDITLGRNGKLRVYLLETVRIMGYKYKILKKLIKYYINEYY